MDYEIETDYVETNCGDFWEWQVVFVGTDDGIKHIFPCGVCDNELQAIGEAGEALRR